MSRNGVAGLWSPWHTAHFQRLMQVWSTSWHYLFILWSVKASESNSEVTVILQPFWLQVIPKSQVFRRVGQLWVRPVRLVDSGQPSYSNTNSASFLHRAHRKYISNSESVSSSYSQNCVWTTNRVSLKVELKLKSYSRSSQPKCLQILNLDLIKLLPPFSTISREALASPLCSSGQL